MSYMVQLGRLRFRTAHTTELELGDGLEAVGAALVAGERRPRPLPLTLAVRADETELDPRAVGQRLRAQVEAWLENPRLRLEGAWFAFGADPLLASYLLVGGGTLGIDDDALTFGEYVLELEGAYRVGRLTTHRPARRLDVLDLRLPTSPRDPRETYFGTDFATFGATPLVAFPRGARNIRRGLTPVAPGGISVRQGVGGTLYDTFVSLLHGPEYGNGEVLGFDYSDAGDPTRLTNGDVVLYDRPPGTSRDYNPAPPAPYNPADAGWVEVYGPTQALAGDVPVIDNGACRVRYLNETDAGGATWHGHQFAIERFESTLTGYVDVGRVVPAPDVAANLVLERVMVREWTPERTVMRAVFGTVVFGGLSTTREVWITLQRGWSGPRFDMYGGAAADTCRLIYVPPLEVTDPATFLALNLAASGVVPHIDPAGNYTAQHEAQFTARDPWVALAWTRTGPVAAPGTVVLTPGRAATTSSLQSTALAYPQTRAGVQFAATSWVSMRIAFAEPATYSEAETRLGPTIVPGSPDSFIAGNPATRNEATASGGVEATQTSWVEPAGITVRGATVFGTTNYIAARVRAATSVGRVSTDRPATRIMIPRVGDTYQNGDWRYAFSVGTVPELRAYSTNSGSGAQAFIDRFAVIAATTPSGNGVLDRARQALMDSRAIPTLVAR